MAAKLKMIEDKKGGPDQIFLAKFGVWEGDWAKNKEAATISLIETLIQDYNILKRQVLEKDKLLNKLERILNEGN